MTGLFSGMFGRGPAAAETGGEAWLRAMLDAEAALARALARTGLAAAEHAEAIAAACRDHPFDAGELGRAAAASANPVVPLVKAVTAAVGGDAARHVHQGATSQDIMDTAAMLVARRAGAAAAAEARSAADGLAALAERHRGSVMAGRTLLQQALPTTFGLVAAGWMAALDDAAAAVLAETGERARAQFGGAAGTLASLGDRGPAVAAAFADELGLARPLPPWHTDRGPVVSAAGALARLSGAAGKAAGDIVLLAQTEVAEVAEAGGAGVGGSSTMPHKRNPVAAVSAVACAEQAPGLAATLLAAQLHQPHQRAAGAWQAEWEPLDRLLRSTGSAVSWLAESVRRLRPDPDRMRRNLDLTGGFPLAERVATDLAPQLGRLPAHELVQRACAEAAAGGGDLAAALTAHLDGLRTGEEIAALLDPAGYLGAAPALVDAALERHRAAGAR